jgi:hypothetical protein
MLKLGYVAGDGFEHGEWETEQSAVIVGRY